MYANKDDLSRFFATMPEMIPTYERLEQRINEICGEQVDVRVQKSQIAFFDKHGFSWASLPIRRRKGWPEKCLVVTFGLEYRKESPRIAVAVEPHPHRWTHHVLAQTPDAIDDELMAWIEESHRFSLAKRRRTQKPRD